MFAIFSVDVTTSKWSLLFNNLLFRPVGKASDRTKPSRDGGEGAGHQGQLHQGARGYHSREGQPQLVNYKLQSYSATQICVAEHFLFLSAPTPGI